MRRLPLFLLPLVLAACTAATPQDSASDSSLPSQGAPLSIAFEKSVNTDSEATVSTAAKIRFEGVVDATVDLGELLGELMPVHPQTYDNNTLAVFTTWWAGAGDDVRVRHDVAKNALVIEERMGDESGECTDWEMTESIALPEGTQALDVQLTGADTPLEKSSLAWCDEAMSSSSVQ